MIVVNPSIDSIENIDDEKIDWHTINNQLNQTKGLLGLFKDEIMGNLSEKDLALTKVAYEAAAGLEQNLNVIRLKLKRLESDSTSIQQAINVEDRMGSTVTDNSKKLLDILEHFSQPLRQQILEKNFVCVGMVCNELLDRISFCEDTELRGMINQLAEKAKFLEEKPGEHNSVEQEVNAIISQIVDFHHRLKG